MKNWKSLKTWEGNWKILDYNVIIWPRNTKRKLVLFNFCLFYNLNSLEKQLDKSLQTDGSGPQLFNLFVKRTKENLHIIFAMSPLSDTFRYKKLNFTRLNGSISIFDIQMIEIDSILFKLFQINNCKVSSFDELLHH